MKKLFLGIILISGIAISCKQNNKTNDQSSQTTQSKQVNTLAMSQVWQGPYGGVPPFDKVVISDFVSALESEWMKKKRDSSYYR